MRQEREREKPLTNDEELRQKLIFPRAYCLGWSKARAKESTCKTLLTYIYETVHKKLEKRTDQLRPRTRARKNDKKERKSVRIRSYTQEEKMTIHKNANTQK